MDDRLSRVESTLAEVERSVAALDRRIALLEQQIAVAAGIPRFTSLGDVRLKLDAAADDWIEAPSPLALRTADRREPSAVQFSPPGIVPVLSLIGRTFVVLGGAFLLRALTDSGLVPVAGGVALGLVYAVAWLIAADRASAAGRQLSASVHGLAALIIALPLIWEAATRFAVLGPAAAARVLSGIIFLTFAVAVRRRLHALAWLATVGSLMTIVALVAETGVLAPFALFAIVLGICTLWIGYALDWTLLRWPAALVADIFVLALPARIAAGSGPETLATVLALQLLLLSAYLASIAARTLLKQRDVNLFEVVQTTTALTIGFGGAVQAAHAAGWGAAMLASATLLIGIGCYAAAFAFVARRQGIRRNFYFYTSLALALVLISAALLLNGSALAIASLLLAAATSWLGRRAGRRSLALHAAAYAIVSAGASGLLGAATAAMLLPPSQWPSFSATAMVVLAALVSLWAIRVADDGAPNVPTRQAQLLITVVLFWSMCGWTVARLVPPVAAVLGGADPALVATVRTAVLSAGSVLLAWVGCHHRFRETGWLLYPVLVAAGLKLLAEDVPRSKPSALFVALAVYGIALIAAPRLRPAPDAPR